MKQKRKTNKAAVFLSALALCAWCACVFMAQKVDGFAVGPSIRWEANAGVSPTQVQRGERYAREDGSENIPQATLWRACAAQSLSRPDGGGFASADVTEVYGESGMLYPLTFSSGGWPVRGDSGGCALDEATAVALWGGTEVVGMEITWDGKTYTVRGVFRGLAGLLVVQGVADSAERYPGMLLSFPEGGGKQEAQDYLKRNLMSAGSVLDLGFLAWCLNALAAAPGLLLALGILIRLLRRGWWLRVAPLFFAQYLLPALCGGGLVLWATGVPWHLPDRLIPTRWSDFEFWSRLVREFGETVRALLARTPTRWDLAVWGPILLCLTLVPLSAALTVLAAERVHARSDGALLLGGLAFLGGLFAFCCVSFGGMAISRGMWLLPLFWLAADRALFGHTFYLKSGRERGGRDEPKPLPVQAEALRSGDAGSQT